MNDTDMYRTTLVTLLALAPLASAMAFDVEAVKTRVAGDFSKVITPAIVKAVEAQNAKHAGLTDADIKTKDSQWRAEVTASSRPMIDGVLNSGESKALKSFVGASGGFYSEIFVMDNKGLNVAQSDVTSDYWQGDEAKFQTSFGPNATFADEVEMDEST